MKKYILLPTICYFILTNTASIKAQDWINMMKDQKANVHDVQKAFNTWCTTHKKENTKVGNNEEKDGPYEQFKRWEWLMEPRTYPSGKRPAPGAIAKQYADYLKDVNTHSVKHSPSVTANWTYAGNDSVPEYGGDGRVNYLRFMPGNNNIIFACGPTGGLWETTNGGTTWSTKTDNLIDMSVSDIAIDPTNTNVMYISTGDGDGIYGGYTTLSTVGVLKSTDGGTTWNPTGLSFPQATSGPAFSTVNQLLLDSNNTSVILAGTSFGLYKTTNGGTSWNQVVDTGDFRSLEFEPYHSRVVYASTLNGQFYRSTDTGTNWTFISTGLPVPTAQNRVKIAITPADSNYVYVVVGNTGTYRSVDRGQTFTNMSASDQIGYQEWYTMSLCVSPTNADSLIEGGLDNYASADGGVTWNQVSSWTGSGYPYVHADVHCITPIPGSGAAYIECNDGGVFEFNQPSTDTWEDLSHNLEIGALYNIGPSASTPGLWLSGWQDNGVNLSAPFWQEVYGGDGMISFIDYTNDLNWFAENYSGDFLNSPDGGFTWNSISNVLPYGPWVTKWMQDPQNPNSLYGGFNDVWSSPDQGNTWAQISTWGSIANPNAFISAICIDPKNDSIIYAAQPGIIEFTTNAGNTWTDITGTLPISNAGISSIACDPLNPSRVWVSFSGYSAPDKVYQSINKGVTWTDISTSLPNLPVNCILFQQGSPNESIYIGTDAGVYYRDTILNSWVSYNTHLPNVIVNDLQIYYPTNTLLAATYGRGVWSSPTYVNSIYLGVNTLQNENGSFNVYPNPTNGNVKLDVTIAQQGDYTISIYNMLGQKVYSNNVNISGRYTSDLNMASYGKGVYLFILNGQRQSIEKKIVVN